jgi:hypothetical protein
MSRPGRRPTPITAAVRPVKAKARTACRSLKDRMATPAKTVVPVRDAVLAPRAVVAESTAPPRTE